ncbi:MAG: hypothetical protein M3Q68_09390 [Actinomycetota bacterium]|nr:hypothetical protein [Actinomycetota bacterium]
MTQVRNDDEVRGPLRRPVNGAAGAKGSIHDDATAQKLGFRGGTVAGSIHMDQFPPMLVEAFGPQWFETGSLSLQFRNATVGGEAVQVILGSPPTADAVADAQVPVRVEREDGLLVAEGTAGVGASQPPTHLDGIDMRPAGDPSELRMFSGLPAGTPIDEHEAVIDSASTWWAELSERITEPLEWYAGSSPWGGAIVGPSAIVQLLWQKATASFGRHGGGAVGLFGSIEIRHHRGPVFLDHPYRVTGEIVAVGHSPKTEYVWFDTRASDDDGVVASMRMQLRWMKASSKAYAST